ncbi:MAG: recombinase family protein [Lachnospiraceae bacterium]|nr:recombinase family protein [Lachnospiraceae bacterium]
MQKSNQVITALYSRLSCEDDLDGDSNSIINQKKILEEYAVKNRLPNVRHFIDDGFTGSNFERPSFRELLELVKAGQVGAVVVKDLSRLGRDYITTGSLVEVVFPQYGVRFIAVNDSVDTSRRDNEMMIFRNVFNDFYSRDTSKKVQAVKAAAAKRGERVNGKDPYGYVKSPDNRSQLLVDEVAAPVVREIFRRFAEGKTAADIVRWLYAERIKTPAAYRAAQRGYAVRGRAKEEPYLWAIKSVYEILDRVEYLGHTETAKSVTVNYRLHKVKHNQPEARNFFPDTHEPIIEQAVWDVVKKRRENRTRRSATDVADLFGGLLYCPDCGRKMNHHQKQDGRYYYYLCSTYTRRNPINKGECTVHSIKKSDLMAVVLENLQRVTSFAKAHEEQFVRQVTRGEEKKLARAAVVKAKELDRAKNRHAELDTLFQRVYEDFAAGRLTAERYEKLSSAYDAEQKTLAERIAVTETELNAATEQADGVQKFLKMVRRYTDIQELTYENLREFIEKIHIYEKNRETGEQRVDVFYNFIGVVAPE